MPGEVTDELRDAWTRFLAVLFTRRDEMFAVLAKYGLTPPHGHALGMLSSGPLRMRDMADAMTCDASYITSIVDRLEELGFAERTASAADRRVKEIALTRKGRRTADAVSAVVHRVPDSFLALDPADQRELSRLLELVLPDTVAPADPFRPTARRIA